MKMFLSKLKTRLRSEKSGFSNETQVCKNCETQFKGNYCPNCGQSVKEVDKPFSIIFYDFLGNIFAFDTRFYKSLTITAKFGNLIEIQFITNN